MNRDDVRKALHVDTPASQYVNWPGPMEGWSYKSDYAACNGDAPPGTLSMVDFYRNLAPRLTGPVVVYNGDTDPCVSYEGTRAAILKVGFAQLDGHAYRPWFFNSSSSNAAFLRDKPLLYGPDLALHDAGP